MLDWEWIREEVEPEDILDAARTISPTTTQITVDPTANWVSAGTYRDWSFAAIARRGDDSWDAAATWAKRSVCQRMDAILVNNHFGSRLGDNYKQKAEYLAKLKVPGLSVLHELVIDPRNDIEHSYVRASEEHARRATDIAQLFLGATNDFVTCGATASLGWNVSSRTEICTKSGHERELY